MISIYCFVNDQACIAREQKDSRETGGAASMDHDERYHVQMVNRWTSLRSDVWDRKYQLGRRKDWKAIYERICDFGHREAPYQWVPNRAAVRAAFRRLRDSPTLVERRRHLL